MGAKYSISLQISSKELRLNFLLKYLNTFPIGHMNTNFRLRWK